MAVSENPFRFICAKNGCEKKNVLRMKMQNKINTNNGPSEGLYCSCAHFYMIITVTRLCELKRKVAKITKNTKPSQFHLVPAYSIVSVLV